MPSRETCACWRTVLLPPKHTSPAETGAGKTSWVPPGSRWFLLRILEKRDTAGGLPSNCVAAARFEEHNLGPLSLSETQRVHNCYGCDPPRSGASPKPLSLFSTLCPQLTWEDLPQLLPTLFSCCPFPLS